MPTITSLTAEHYKSSTQGTTFIGTPSPRLSWRFASTGEKNWIQQSCEVHIRRGESTEAYVVESSQSVLGKWPSGPLASRERAVVRVRSTGEDGSATPWAELTVEATLFHTSDWKAQVISCPASAQTLDAAKRPIYLRRTILLDTEPTDARIYITALGLYEISINGVRVGDHYLAPGWQSYNHRLAYQVFDVSGILREGENVIEGIVGEGWYAGRLGFGGGRRNVFGERIGLLMQLEVEREAVVVTDESWEWSFGPTVSSEIYEGEHYDSRESKTWSPVSIIPHPRGRLVYPQSPPVRATHVINIKRIIRTPSGKTVLDFGQNLVGWCRFNAAPKGPGEVVLRHAEVLDKGEVGVEKLRVNATDRVIYGDATSVQGWEPKFTFHGFRQVSSSVTSHSPNYSELI